MQTFLQILQSTVPALIVFLTVYFMFKKFTDSQVNMKMLEMRAKRSDESNSLKYQAYERLLLFCERINPYHLSMRLDVQDMSAKQLAKSMVIAIQQEYEHNLSQQLYVSDTLWQIVNQAKMQTAQLILKAADTDSEHLPSSALIQTIEKYYESVGYLPLDKAKSAIKNEFNSI